ncbi:MAG: lytic transglycosylase domain-containing protein [SAR324 cluster bacterium]|uniref:Lytic transglycosylase domain-containing protein n=1 Tax=SAR324 cluster bacterium TaxID=2024889 RepID=A0A7X9IKN1_9DELT|nr:lytic transglycosylase domain-containing protein [SAR324 cluster bacterium]
MGKYQSPQIDTAKLEDKLPEQKHLKAAQQELVKLRSQFCTTVEQNVINHMAINFLRTEPGRNKLINCVVEAFKNDRTLLNLSLSDLKKYLNWAKKLGEIASEMESLRISGGKRTLEYLTINQYLARFKEKTEQDYYFSFHSVTDEMLEAYNGYNNCIYTVGNNGSTSFDKSGLDSQFTTAVSNMASRLGTNPDWILKVMAFETGGSFSTSIRNPRSGATGLIQFMPSTAKRLGTSTSALAQMSKIEQLKYVEQYFAPYAGKMNTFEDVCMAVFWPAAIGKDPNTTLFGTGTKAYAQNPLDSNRDGKVTVKEYANRAV